MMVLVFTIFAGLFIASLTSITYDTNWSASKSYQIAGFCAFCALLPLGIVDLILYLVAKNKSKTSGVRLPEKVTNTSHIALVFSALMFLVGVEAVILIVKEPIEITKPTISNQSRYESRTYDIEYKTDPNAPTSENLLKVSCSKTSNEDTVIHEGIAVNDELLCHISFASGNGSGPLYFTKLQMNYSANGLKVDKIYTDNYAFSSTNYNFESNNSSIALTDKDPSNQINISGLTPIYIRGTVTDPSKLSLTFTNIYSNANGSFRTPDIEDSTATFTLRPATDIKAEIANSAPASLYGYKIINGEWGQADIYVNNETDSVILDLYKLTNSVYKKINQAKFNNRLAFPVFDFNAGTITYNFTSQSGDCYRKILNFESLEETETTDACRDISQ